MLCRSKTCFEITDTVLSDFYYDACFVEMVSVLESIKSASDMRLKLRDAVVVWRPESSTRRI